MTPDEAEAAAEAAHDRGVLVRAHVVNRRGLELALDVGIDIIDHGDDLDDRLIARMAEAGTYLAPSLLTTREVMRAYGGPNQGFDNLNRSYGILRDANAAGVKIVVGDDYGSIVVPHGIYGQELSLYVDDAGMAPIDVLRWATKNGAELLGLGDHVGTLRPGKLADLLVVDGDPLDDISVLEDSSRLLAIMKGGVLVKDELARLDHTDQPVHHAAAV
jgi:imidazolonepropionase-like amidohydrolase